MLHPHKSRNGRNCFDTAQSDSKDALGHPTTPWSKDCSYCLKQLNTVPGMVRTARLVSVIMRSLS